ncbi:MAG: YkgJ family cysteine cluster protein [Candidatus Krumholzibacteriota bacterium]|nr:YkgJ family cysteine cluster protein [Candidatus Krumholzibacteriota bacterium]
MRKKIAYNRKKKLEKKPTRPKNRCDDCIPAKCCMYFSVEIDEPENRKDWDDMLWILAHRDVQIYMNDDRWYVLVMNECRFYTPDRGCLIYPKRPLICRAHTWKDCEFKDDYNFDLHFHNYEELERYLRNNPQ